MEGYLMKCECTRWSFDTNTHSSLLWRLEQSFNYGYWQDNVDGYWPPHSLGTLYGSWMIEWLSMDGWIPGYDGFWPPPDLAWPSYWLVGHGQYHEEGLAFDLDTGIYFHTHYRTSQMVSWYLPPNSINNHYSRIVI